MPPTSAKKTDSPNPQAEDASNVRSDQAPLSAAESEPEATRGDDDQSRVRISYFPRYSQLRALLPILERREASTIHALHRTLREVSGTREAPVMWGEPDLWIPERLHGATRELAQEIWESSQKTVNPRYTLGSWWLARCYNLIESSAQDELGLTQRGRDFLEHERGCAERYLDEQEGLLKILELVVDDAPVKQAELLSSWGNYLATRSKFQSPSMMYNALRVRLNNLLERGLVEKESGSYRATSLATEYLQRLGTSSPGAGTSRRMGLSKIKQSIEAHHLKLKAELRESLHCMDPIAFEHLIRKLLEEMGYRQARVTKQSGDGGVDVVATIKLGISEVKEVVQAKRHRGAIQRKDLDALRGSLHRFDAVRGSIITTSTFARGTREAVFEAAAPITLIDGAHLVELLITHGIGVRKQEIELCALDLEQLEELQDESE